MTDTCAQGDPLIEVGPAAPCALAEGEYLFSGSLVDGGRLHTGASARQRFGRLLGEHSLDELLARLNGRCAYAIRRDGCLHFGVDHFGGGSLFYSTDPGLRLWEDPRRQMAAEPRADEAFCCLLAAGYTVGDETLYPGIRECAPGVAYTWDPAARSLRERRWFAYDPHGDGDLDPEELERRLLAAMPDGLEPCLLPLSGGLDSRALLALALRRGAPVHAFSYGLPGNRDLVIASELCRNLGLAHECLPSLAGDRTALFGAAGIRDLVEAIHRGRSLPEEHDWIAMHRLSRRDGVICPGHTGDWLSGGHIDARLASLRSERQLVDYLVDLHFGLTALSSRAFRELLADRVRRSLAPILEADGGDWVAAAERWNLEHRQRRYIVNSAAKYDALGYRVHLPFYDRGLMECFAGLKREWKLGQRGYRQVLRERLFTRELQSLALVTNTGAPLARDPAWTDERLSQRAHRLLRRLDPAKRRKRLLPDRLRGYDDAVLLLTDLSRADFLRRSMGTAFPRLPECVAALRDLGCGQAARHLDWVQGQRVCQMNVNGLFLCAVLPAILRLPGDGSETHGPTR